jgi:hypothetical protein
MKEIQWYPIYKLVRDELESYQIYYSSSITDSSTSSPPTDRPWIFYTHHNDYFMALHDLMHLWLEEYKIQYKLDYQRNEEGLQIGMNSDDMCLFVLYWKTCV